MPNPGLLRARTVKMQFKERKERPEDKELLKKAAAVLSSLYTPFSRASGESTMGRVGGYLGGTAQKFLSYPKRRVTMEDYRLACEILKGQR